jgi:alpha-amylase
MSQAQYPTRLLMVFHNHQPVGNFDFVFEQATDKSYGPLVDLLAEHPKVRVGLHFTGPLLEWLEGHRPELLSMVRAMCIRGQVEILGGGWAEPMLAVLTDADAQGQIRMMRAECARLFGVLPRGMWLAERVWDPDLPRLLRAAEVEYTLLDDTHFRYAGLLQPRLTGHYVTEKAGDAMAVFPIDRQLRYAIPFHEADKAMEEIRSAGPGRTVTYGDDGEKFGVWPETHEWVWQKGWLERFFQLLEDPEQGVELILPSEQIDRYAPEGRVYLPTASYHEMGEWTLNPEAGRQLLDLKAQLKANDLDQLAEPFLHGGIWMGFLAKYPESNILHKRMLRASAKVARATRASSGGDAVVERARRALYRGQCNCPYWHGLFGGLYLPHLRHAVYQQLNRAESLADPIGKPRAEVVDLDADLRKEVVLETAGALVWIDPEEGGQVPFLDHRQREVSLAHVLSRRPETYHKDLLEQAAKKGSEDDADTPKSIHDMRKSKVPDLEARLVYDPYVRRVLVDHLLPAGARLEAVEGPEYLPLADLVHLSHEIHEAASDSGSAWVELRGSTPLLGEPGGNLHLVKRVRLVAPATLEAEYELTWQPQDANVKGPLAATFAVESALALVPGSEESFHVALIEPSGDPQKYSPQERGGWERASRLVARSAMGDVTVAMTLDPQARMSCFPLDTVSQSEDGAELVYQGTVFLASWPVEFTPDQPLRRKISFLLE